MKQRYTFNFVRMIDGEPHYDVTVMAEDGFLPAHLTYCARIPIAFRVIGNQVYADRPISDATKQIVVTVEM